VSVWTEREDMAARSNARLKKCFFVYLLVRPYCNTCDLCIDTVLGGEGLPAKILAKNESLRQPSRLLLCSAPLVKRWRVLLGFYAHKSNWLRKIKTEWNKDCAWEDALLQGVKFAIQFSVNKVLYISSEARSDPRSALLSGLQSLCVEKNVKRKLEMMSIVMSNKTTEEKLSELLPD